MPKLNGPEISKRNCEWFERVCPKEVTARAAAKCIGVLAVDQFGNKAVTTYERASEDSAKRVGNVDLKRSILEARERAYKDK